MHSIGHSPDQALADRIRSGDKTACAECIELHAPAVYRLALNMLRDEAAAEDVVQETFLNAFAAIDRFEWRSGLSTWLYRIAVNEALMSIRKRKPMPISMDEGRDDEDADSTGMEIVDWCCQPEREMLSSEARAKMDEAVQSLPQALRVVFIMRDIEGLSIQETAEVLNLGESAVKVRLLRARLRLRQELSLYFGSKMQKEGRA